MVDTVSAWTSCTLCGIIIHPCTFLPHPLTSLLHIPKWVPSAFGTSPRHEGAGKAHHFPVNTFLLACADPFIPELEGTGRCRVDSLSEQPRPRFSSLPWTLIYAPSRLMGDAGYFLPSPLGNRVLVWVETCWKKPQNGFVQWKTTWLIRTVIFLMYYVNI